MMIIKLPVKLILAVLGSIMGLTTVCAQVSLKEISLKEQINNSSLVVEGQVISQKSFWDADHRLIYTAHTVDIYKVFKGEVVETIEVLTLGGVVGLNAMIASNTLKLREGNVGVFTLYDSKVSLYSKGTSKNKIFQAYSSLQGFYKYNLHHNAALNPFNKKQGVQSSFYNEIMIHTKSSYIEVADFNVNNEHQKLIKSNRALILGITDFSPSTRTAGTGSTIIINGTDFGDTQGKVGFANADSGGVSMGFPDYINALDTQVVSWTSTQIEVEVPDFAGTGKIRITHNDTSTLESTTDLTITYAQNNVIADFGGGFQAFETQHYDDNNSGGYTWEMYTDFFNETEPGIIETGYKAAFLRAFESWRCATKINWEVSATVTTIDVIGKDDDPADGELEADGTNVIRFDNGSELDAGVLGRCTSWYQVFGCSPIVWRVGDLDIVFDDDANWYFGGGTIASGEFDFETVALHELGHGHQLGHVINPNNVMHYILTSGTANTTLDANSISAANNIQSRSTTNQACGTPFMPPLMTNYSGSCGLNVENFTLENSISLYPNPTKKEFFIKSTIVNLDKVEIYDVSGRLISQIDVSNASRTIPVNLAGASKGMYFVNIHSDINFITKKLVIE